MKTMLSPAELEAQTALELPDREMLLIVAIINVETGDILTIDVRNVRIAAAVCALVQAIAVLSGAVLACEVQA